MENSDLAKGHFFTNKVYVDLNMLGPAMLHWIRRHVNGADIVAENHSSRGEWLM
jgi:hypothetical protein